eukprot:Colp12_sorted_trinity150504_noHs@35656
MREKRLKEYDERLDERRHWLAEELDIIQRERKLIGLPPVNPVHYSFADLPEVCVMRIFSFLDFKSLMNAGKTCKSWNILSLSESLWYQLCIKKWPYFFYTGKCQELFPWEPTLLEEDRARLHPDVPPLPERPIPKCKHHHVGFQHYPLPELHYEAFKEIYTGQWFGPVLVMSPLENLQNSSQPAVAVYRAEDDSVGLTFFAEAFEAGPPEPYLMAERLSASSDRLRRIPEEIRDYTPTMPYFVDLMKMEGRPLDELGVDAQALPALLPGEVVEVQWTNAGSMLFGWWYGIVEAIEPDYIVVVFPQYLPESVWARVYVRRNCEVGPTPPDVEEPTGLCGGIRRITCPSVRELYRRHWEQLDF